MKLSILDQSPISSGQSAKEALEATVELARLADRLGFKRFWVAEHHDLYGLASPNPAVMLGIIGEKTEKIRIGAGAVLLPYYKPYRVAETYNLLETLYPGRVDLGLGRAPGGSAEVSIALSDNYLKEVRYFPESVEELKRFLHQDFPTTETYGKIKPTPVPETPPIPWMLGTSEKSAELAAKNGMHYCFGDFMTKADGPKAIQVYREGFYSEHGEKPYTMVAVSAICAPTAEEADALAISQSIWQLKQDKMAIDTTIPSVKSAEEFELSEEEKIKIERRKKKMIIGTPAYVVEQLETIQEEYQADEMMILTITHDKKIKQRSYELIMQQLAKKR